MEQDQTHFSFDQTATPAAPQEAPLALKMRPAKFEHYVGQEHLIRELKNFGTRLPHLILWGPPGSGKTTLAHLLAKELGLELFTFNAVMAGVPELKKLIAHILEQSKRSKCALFIDEIHRFNKSQQDALLPYLERGDFIFMGATTEYPQTALNRALLSRVRVLGLKALTSEQLTQILEKATHELERPDLLSHIPEIAKFTNGDARQALNLLSLLNLQTPEALKDQELLKRLFQENRAYDKNQDRHYNVISGFIKSIRGSDPDAALLWLAVMLDGGEDPEFVARRLMILASEDIGLANSQALQVAANAHYVTKHIGMPEAKLTLAHATVFLAISPKSNSAYLGINEAMEFVAGHPTLEVPEHIASTGPGKRFYKYPHDFPGHWVAQSYRPVEASLSTFYKPGKLGSEAAMVEIWRRNQV